MNKAPCYYLPKEMLTSKYKNFSVESKLLFSMIFTNATNDKAIKEAASLINNISSNKLHEMHCTFLKCQKDVNMKSEGA